MQQQKILKFQPQIPSLQLLFPRKSQGCLPPTSPGRPLKILFDHLYLTPWGRPNLSSRGRRNLMFKGRPWEVYLGRPQDVLSMSPRGTSGYSNWDVSIFSFRTYSIGQIYLKAFQHSRCIENPLKRLRWMKHFLQN